MLHQPNQHPVQVSFIGAGNVAWHLSKAVENAGYGVADVFSRNRRHAEVLAKRLYDAKSTDRLDFSKSPARLFFLTLPDQAHEEVIQKLVLPENAVLVHTSGSRMLRDFQEMLALNNDLLTRYGVFYPLQTFSKTVALDMANVPICIEAPDPATEAALIKLGQDISQTVYLVNSVERRVLHIAGIFASNFTNHLWAVSKNLLDEHHLEFDLLKPLIQETTRKALTVAHPADAQTGPAIRNDSEIIRQHLAFLKDKKGLQNLYNLLTRSIQEGV